MSYKEFELKSLVDADGANHHLMVLLDEIDKSKEEVKLSSLLSPPLCLLSGADALAEDEAQVELTPAQQHYQQRQKERLEQQEKIGGSGGSKRIKSFHKKTHILHVSEYNDAVRAKLDNLYQRSLVDSQSSSGPSSAKTTNATGIWRLEDSEGTSYIGKKEDALSGDASCYVFFENHGNSFRVILCKDWFKFQPKITYNTLSYEEAEAEMNGKGGSDRWIMKHHNQKKKQSEEPTAAGADKKLSLKERLLLPNNAPAATGSSGKNKRRGGGGGDEVYEDDELDYEDVFEDDEEGGFDGLFTNRDEEVADTAVMMAMAQADVFKEQQSKVRGLYTKRDYDDDEDEDGEGSKSLQKSKPSKKMKKLLKRDGDNMSDSASINDDDEDDDDVDPYASLDEEEEEGEEAAKANVAVYPGKNLLLPGATIGSNSVSARASPLVFQNNRAPSPAYSTSSAPASQSKGSSGSGRSKAQSSSSRPESPLSDTLGKRGQTISASSSTPTSPVATTTGTRPTSSLTPSIKKLKLSVKQQQQPASQSSSSSSVASSKSTSSTSIPSAAASVSGQKKPLSQSDIIPLLMAGPITTRELLQKLAKKLKELPENRQLLKSILNTVATMKPGASGEKQVELKPEFQ